MDDGSFDFGSYGSDFGSFDSAGSDFAGSDLMSQYSGGADVLGSYGNAQQPYFSNLQADPAASVASAGGGGIMGGLGGLFGGGGGGGLGAPGAGGLGGGGSLAALLGLGGAGAGLLGTILGKGVTGTTTPQLPTAARAQLNQSNQALQPFALGQTPLQQQQAGMLQALSQGQVPPGFAQLVANAYDPAYQNAATRATTAARQAGFYDNPLSSPVGGNIMGPAAAQLQGQQANSLLALMQSLPQLFNQPIQTQAGAAGQQSNSLLNAARMQTGSQQSQPLAPQIGQAVGAGLQGIGQGMAANQQAAQSQQNWNSLLQAMGGGGNNTMSQY
jgi:hypothetical protein